MQSTQFGRVILWTFLFWILLMVFSYLFRLKQKVSKQIFLHILVSVILALIFILSYDLTINIDKTNFSFDFGPWVIQKTYPIKQIKSCKPVVNKRRYGYGVRRVQNSWLYNVSGLKAVELEFFNNEKRIRVWTNNPEEICRRIKEVK